MFTYAKVFAAIGIRLATERLSEDRTKEQVIGMFKTTRITSNASIIFYSSTANTSNYNGVVLLKVTQNLACLHETIKATDNRLKGLYGGCAR
jgi:hypothetical protein